MPDFNRPFAQKAHFYAPTIVCEIDFSHANQFFYIKNIYNMCIILIVRVLLEFICNWLWANTLPIRDLHNSMWRVRELAQLQTTLARFAQIFCSAH